MTAHRSAHHEGRTADHPMALLFSQVKRRNTLVQVDIRRNHSGRGHPSHTRFTPADGSSLVAVLCMTCHLVHSISTLRSLICCTACTFKR